VAQNDDDAWRAIVDNYGDRPDLEDHPEDPAGRDVEDAEDAEDTEDAGDPAAVADDLGGRSTPPAEPGWNELFPDADWEEERFVPPPPPPLPTTTADRMAAWVGVFGSPVVLLICLVLGFKPPELITYLLVVGFVGGFLYLVLKMNREPRDPDDNGAVL